MNLEDARQHVESLIEDRSIPAQLPGGLTLEELIEIVTKSAQEEIRSRLTVDGMSEEALSQAVEQAALRAALICLYATGETDDPSDADVALGITSESVTQILRKLLTGHPVSISISVDDD